MFLKDYFSCVAGGYAFSRAQASAFAKGVAADFNPIHDEDAKRFCVPGDLLFAMLLAKQGLHQTMHCNFAGMVGGDLPLFLSGDDTSTRLADENGKTYLEMAHGGEVSHDMALIETLVRRYVRFSGQNFPPILVPLMCEQQVMINPARPLVMYQSMSVTLSHLALQDPQIVFTGAELDVQGKRGNATLRFDFVDQEQVVGHGQKEMVLSGLVPYQQQAMDDMVAFYLQRREAFGAAKNAA